MGDVALVWSSGSADIVADGDDLASDEGMRTAVLLSLFTDRRAEDDDQLPGEDDDRRGWWGDEFLQVAGDKIGSRLWLLERAKRTSDVLADAEVYARESLAWMLEDRVTDEIVFEAEFVGDQLRFAVDLKRPSGDPVAFRFAHVWNANAIDFSVAGAEPTPDFTGPTESIGFLFLSPQGDLRVFARGPSGVDLRGFLNQLGLLG